MFSYSVIDKLGQKYGVKSTQEAGDGLFWKEQILI